MSIFMFICPIAPHTTPSTNQNDRKHRGRLEGNLKKIFDSFSNAMQSPALPVSIRIWPLIWLFAYEHMHRYKRNWRSWFKFHVESTRRNVHSEIHPSNPPRRAYEFFIQWVYRMILSTGLVESTVEIVAGTTNVATCIVCTSTAGTSPNMTHMLIHVQKPVNTTNVVLYTRGHRGC